jgi:hypothetical protein
MIEEQLRPENLPTWWFDEEKKQGRGGDHDVHDAD